MSRTFTMFAITCLLVATSYGQNSSSSDQAETIKLLQQEVEMLKTRLAAVESRQEQSPNGAQLVSATYTPAAAPAPAPAVQDNPAMQNFGLVKGIKFQGFGEVGWKANDHHAGQTPTFGFSNGPNGNFSIGDFDLFLTSRINEKTSVLAEMVFGESDAQSFDIDMERVLLKYDHNDYLKLSFGRFHTATSYYNSVFHSGKWLQTPVNRPLVVEFANDGGLLPTQAVGLSVTGKIPSGKLGLNYVFEYGTSDTIRPDINDREAAETDESNGNGITAGIYMKPDWAQGLDIGGSFYHDRLNPTDTGFHIGQSIISGHVVYTTPKFEFINEAFLIQHAVDGLRTFNTPAFYSLISYSVAPKWRPFFMYQYANANSTRVIFDDVALRHGPSVGVRYDFNSYVGFKTQYEHTFRRTPLSGINTVSTQLAFRF